ncbi:MAG TPA: twin-arginine translocase subunit TatC [Acidimicrobiales bacterium]|nr:twin-arginine translocase subunit TatC [Acidimicrobiales bacterium]
MATLIRRRNGPRPSPDAMTLSEHLGELRQRLIVCLVGFVICAVATYLFYNRLLGLLDQPYCVSLHVPDSSKACDLTVLGPLDGFAIRLNVTGYGGLIIASPIILYQLWRFITPGLKANERRYALPFVFATVGLFLVGALVAWITFPHALGFLHAVSGPHINTMLTAQKYISLIMALMAIFGLTFEFPVVLVALELAGVLTPQKLAKWRRIAIMVIVVFAAVITPSSDPFSMLALAIPMLVFYELSIVVGKLVRRNRPVAEE